MSVLEQGWAVLLCWAVLSWLMSLGPQGHPFKCFSFVNGTANLQALGLFVSHTSVLLSFLKMRDVLEMVTQSIISKFQVASGFQKLIQIGKKKRTESFVKRQGLYWTFPL